ncbi:MAG TPA: LysR family transcriptional regulator [Caldimonas sp.]|jgi:DNA-binding transcriptional LysR family regulator|nr:LysR family transcriptional regulator [Caldimonas sp.]HEX2541396.1 LysR family transcriptional regulator [Caldimonas sp.]
MDRLRRLEIFVKVVDAGSFAQAARLLLITPSAVSHAIGELEREMGLVVFYRTTRQLRLSAEGAELLPHARDVLERMRLLDGTRKPQRGRATGTLRVAVPSGIARHILMPALPRFIERHPDVQIEMINSGSVIDMHVSGADLNFRIGPMNDSGLIARPLAQFRFGVYASPGYLARRGTPHHPRDLGAHRTLIHKPPQSATIKPWDQWTYERPGDSGVVQVAHHLVTDDREALLEAALAGAGVFRIGMFAPHLLSSGRLVRVLADWQWPGGPPFHVLYRRSTNPPRRITAFVEFAVDAVSAFDPLELTLEHR